MYMTCFSWPVGWGLLSSCWKYLTSHGWEHAVVRFWACCQLLSHSFWLLGDPCLDNIQLTKPVSSAWLTSLVCSDFQVDLFEDAWKIYLSSPGMIVWVACLSPISSQNITERKLTLSSMRCMKKNSNASPDLQDTSQNTKRKYQNTNTVIAVSQDTLSMKRTPSSLPMARGL